MRFISMLAVSGVHWGVGAVGVKGLLYKLDLAGFMDENIYNILDIYNFIDYNAHGDWEYSSLK